MQASPQNKSHFNDRTFYLRGMRYILHKNLKWPYMYMFFKTIDFDMLLQTFLHGISSVYTFNYMQVRKMPLPFYPNNVETEWWHVVCVPGVSIY